ncbi:MAG: response regulator [Rhabdochlamydiaceae bacterium]
MKKSNKKILIVDNAHHADLIANDERSSNYSIELAHSGEECLEKIKQNFPDLIFLDLFLSDIHAIDVVKKIKSSFPNKSPAFIVCSAYPIVQNYNAVMEEGAVYFLFKPYSIDKAYRLFEDFFEGHLKPDPFPFDKNEVDFEPFSVPSNLPSYIKLWGTRGSTAVSGSEYSRYGGHTSCLEVRDGHDFLIIDAGTGIRNLGRMVDKKYKKITILLSHTHLDHVVGLPFFPPIYDPDCEIDIWAPSGFEKSLETVFMDMLAYTLFPVRLEDIQATLNFKTLSPSVVIEIGSLKVYSHYVNHPGPTLGFKIKSKNKIFAYITDNEVLPGYLGHPNDITIDDDKMSLHRSLINFLKDCNFIIHEAQYAPLEYATKMGWGHSSTSNASLFIKFTEIKKWYVTHHDPTHTDENLMYKSIYHTKLLNLCDINCELEMAYDGLVIPLD